ncbi:asparagine synthase C-terminal domain-containing protein [Methylomonas montana]|uniref:asparagine synthetase B family protein n=1 Tax=Methylomonas montana TaxID=3058963 RepID=UPI00265A9F92|nr:asparagine synthase C-terminal domain-containing protein [Methylomonas montana]WKJ91522.1 asparagine synthase C-terminal domain-containing protein [Methylomonas montana]
MTKFVGWIGGDLQNEGASRVLERMVATDFAPNYLQGQWYALASASSDVRQSAGAVLLTPQSGSRPDRQQHLLDAYLNQGADFLIGLPEADALVLIDFERQRLVLATDPIGLSHIYYAEIEDGVVFGSSADFVVRHPQVSNAIRPQAIFDYIYLSHCPSPGTIYQQVKKLEGGQCLIYQNGQLSIKRYWLPEFTEQTCDLRQAGQELQQALIDAVRGMVDTEEYTGAFLSGGLDSSSVAGALAKVFPGKAKTFSMGFKVEGYDEIEYANLAVQHFKTRQHEYYVTPEDTVNAVPAIAAYYDEPFGNSSALAAYYCAKLAKEHGVNRLLAGDGGDEIFAGNERYAKQMLFDNYHRLPSFVSAGLEAVLNSLPNALAKQKLPFKAKRYIEQANAAMPDRLQDYNFLHRHAAADIFQADFLAQIDTGVPLQQLRDTYHRPENVSTLNRMLYMDWKSTLHDNDLVKVNRMCEMAGVEVCYPLLDRRMIDLSCRIPSHDKLRGQKLRWFYKQAMADFLPERIINKPKHGFGLPFGVWLRDHQPLKELAYGAIQGLKKRGFFKPEFLDHAIHMHQTIHAAYYGELIWILMMLELWFVGKGL